VDLLLKWKKNAEQKSLLELGKTQGITSEVAVTDNSAQNSSTFQKLLDTVSLQAETISRLSLAIPADVDTNNTPDDKWKVQVEWTLKWSESGEPSKIEAAKNTVETLRSDPGFNLLSPVLRARVATAAAICAMHVGELDIADKEASEALRLHPDNIVCLANAAGIALVRDNFDRAIDLAQLVIDKEFCHANAALVLVQSWYYAGQQEKIEGFLHNNPWFLEMPDGCAALGRIRSHEGRYNEAIDLARQGLRKDRHHLQSLELLYDALFFPLRNKILSSSEWDYGHETARRLRRAEGAISRAISILEKGPNRSKLHQALANRAAVRSSQEKVQDALADCDRILHNTPTSDNRDVASLNKALILIHNGRAVEAIPLLESLENDHWRREGAFALAYSYQVDGQIERAIRIWEKIWKPEECSSSELMTAEMLLKVYQLNKNDTAAESVIKRALEACPTSHDVQSLIAQYKFDSGDADAAVEILRTSIRSLESQSDEAGCLRLLLRLGDICNRDGRFADAIAAWDKVGWDRLFPHYRTSLLNAHYREGHIAEALEIARRIHSEVGITSSAATIEAAICGYMGAWGEAQSIWAQLAYIYPNEPLYRANEAQAALHVDDTESARSALKLIRYETVKDNAVLLRRISKMFATVGMKEAIPYAFRARQIDFGNPESHRNYVVTFMESTNTHNIDEAGVYSDTRAADILGLNGPEWGHIPCTIRLQPTNSSDERDQISYTILSEGPYDRTHKIHSKEDEISQRLLRIRSGEEIVSIREKIGEPAREYRVATVMSPYVHAFQESPQKGAEWFSEAAGVWAIDVSEGFDQFFSTMDEYGRDFDETMKQYAEWRFPLCTVASVRNRSLFDLWFQVTRNAKVGLHAARSSSALFEEGIELLQSGNERPALALDPTSLLAIVHLRFEDLIAPHFRLLIPQSLYQEIKELLSGPPTPGFPRDLPIQILTFVEENTEVLPAHAVIQFHPDDIHQWRQVLGTTALDTALLAYEHNALLYSDDAVMREAGKVHPGVGGTHTQCILEGLRREGKIDQECYHEAIEKMFTVRYQHLLLTSGFYIWILGKYRNRINASVRDTFRALEGPLCPDDAALTIASEIIGYVWLSERNRELRFDILDLCLQTLTTNRSIEVMWRNFCVTLIHSNSVLYNQWNALREILRFMIVWKYQML
jgi:tetratricopeptide (TPR) repeat protein